MTERDFFRLFDRVTEHISLKGCYSREDIMLRIKASKAYRVGVQRVSTAKKTKGKWVKEKGSMHTLLQYGFDRRVIDEANKDRHGIVNLTLLFGKPKAIQVKKLVGRKKARRWWMRR